MVAILLMFGKMIVLLKILQILGQKPSVDQ